MAGARPAKPGMERTVSRANLLEYVKYSPDAQDAWTEIERRKKVTSKLKEYEEAYAADRALSPLIAARANMPADKHTRWKDLTDVEIAPARSGADGWLKIPLSDFGNLVYRLWLLAMAMGNQPDVFEKLCGGASNSEAVGVGQHEVVDLSELVRRATPEERDRLASEMATVDVEVHPMQLSDQIGQLKTTDSTFDLPAPVAENAGSGREENHSGQ